MFKSNRSSNEPYRMAQIVAYRSRLRRAVIHAAARFLKQNPQWSEYFFEVDFLLNRGLPIIEEYLAGVSPTAAIDLAMAWAEEWPEMTSQQRRACMQALTVTGAELLRLVGEAMAQRPGAKGSSGNRNGTGGEGAGGQSVGVPLAYVQAHRPPGRTTAQLQQLWATVAQQRALPAGV